MDNLQSVVPFRTYLSLKGYNILGIIHSNKKRTIYRAIRETDRKEICIKQELGNGSSKHFRREKLVYNIVKEEIGFPHLIDIICKNEFTYFIMDLLGSSLEKNIKIMQKPFSLKTILMLADQMVSRVQYLHSHGIIHRDIKPDNFVMGRGSNLNQVYLIDFGLSKPYVSMDTGEMKKNKERSCFTGTVRFASINSLKNESYSRRDDVESLMYTLIYLAKGSLPWDSLTTESTVLIGHVRESVSPSRLCAGLPSVFEQLVTYVRSLHFEDRPDYEMMRARFRTTFEHYEFVYDGRFDWIGVQRRISTPNTKKEDKLHEKLNLFKNRSQMRLQFK